jgi:hypothetical protein
MLRLTTSIVPFWLHAKMPPLLFPNLAMNVQQIHDVPLGPFGALPIHFPPPPTIVLTIFLVVDHMLTNPIMQCLRWCVKLI